MKRDPDLYPSPDENVHLIWHRFVKAFMKDKLKPGTSVEEFKYTGYDLMKRVERWAKHYPTQVFVSRCDDAIFAGSLLVCIEHASKNSYHGTSVLYIPQCTGEPPIIFFLYPGHRKELMGVLKKLGKKRT
jgi:hypothetical protein